MQAAIVRGTIPALMTPCTGSRQHHGRRQPTLFKTWFAGWSQQG